MTGVEEQTLLCFNPKHAPLVVPLDVALIKRVVKELVSFKRKLNRQGNMLKGQTENFR